MTADTRRTRGRTATRAASRSRAAFRQGAAALAAGRVVIGLVAIAWPSVSARPWVGEASDDVAARVLGRALGARDIVLGLGALTALPRSQSAGAGQAGAWVAAGALSDALDTVATLAAWPELPRGSRWLVAVAAGGAALAGAACALALLSDHGPG
jgi:hypothetical protein